MVVASAAGGALVGTFVALYGVFFLLLLAGYGLGIWALIDAAGKPDWVWQRTGDQKVTYILLIALGFLACQILSLVTAIIYLTKVRKRLDLALQQGPPAYGYGYGYGYAPPPPGSWVPGQAPPPPVGWVPGQAPPPSVGWVPGQAPPPSVGWAPGQVPPSPVGWAPGQAPPGWQPPAPAPGESGGWAPPVPAAGESAGWAPPDPVAGGYDPGRSSDPAAAAPVAVPGGLPTGAMPSVPDGYEPLTIPVVAPEDPPADSPPAVTREPEQPDTEG